MVSAPLDVLSVTVHPFPTQLQCFIAVFFSFVLFTLVGHFFYLLTLILVRIWKGAEQIHMLHWLGLTLNLYLILFYMASVFKMSTYFIKEI